MVQHLGYILAPHIFPRPSARTGRRNILPESPHSGTAQKHTFPELPSGPARGPSRCTRRTHNTRSRGCRYVRESGILPRGGKSLARLAGRVEMVEVPRVFAVFRVAVVTHTGTAGRAYVVGHPAAVSGKLAPVLFVQGFSGVRHSGMPSIVTAAIPVCHASAPGEASPVNVMFEPTVRPPGTCRRTARPTPRRTAGGQPGCTPWRCGCVRPRSSPGRSPAPGPAPQ